MREVRAIADAVVMLWLAPLHFHFNWRSVAAKWDSSRDMNSPPSYLRSYEAVVRAFGLWPDFHDAPVLAFKYTEGGAGVVELALLVWETTGLLDRRGYLILAKRHLVRFAFRGITDADLSQFIPANILFGLGLSNPEEVDVTDKFEVTLDSAIGSEFCGSFVARTGEVLEVSPCDEKGNRVEQIRPD